MELENHMANKLTAAIYTRVSSDEQVKGESLEIQLQRCQALCEQRDWIVYQHYQDPGYSGDSIEGRPAFSQRRCNVPA
jgi:site-specific DNA recombinase